MKMALKRFNLILVLLTMDKHKKYKLT